MLQAVLERLPERLGHGLCANDFVEGVKAAPQQIGCAELFDDLADAGGIRVIQRVLERQNQFFLVLKTHGFSVSWQRVAIELSKS